MYTYIHPSIRPYVHTYIRTYIHLRIFELAKPRIRRLCWGTQRRTADFQLLITEFLFSCSFPQIRWTSTSGVVWAAGKMLDGAVECAGGKLRVLAVLREASDPAKVAVMRMQLGHVTCCFACIVISDLIPQGVVRNFLPRLMNAVYGADGYSRRRRVRLIVAKI